MQSWIMLAVLATPAGCGCEADVNVPEAVVAAYDQAAEALTPRLKTGSLLFSKGDCLAVRIYTASPYTHVAVVVLEAGQPIVYDSMNGTGVRKLPLDEYLVSQCPDELHVFQPRRDLTAEQGSALQEYLDSQLGRPYGIKHHLTGRRAEGVHCAEYATDALMAIRLLHAERPARVSPASLVNGIQAAAVYDASESIDLLPAAEPAPEPAATGRCARWWLSTRQCFATCCDSLSGWFLCR